MNRAARAVSSALELVMILIKKPAHCDAISECDSTSATCCRFLHHSRLAIAEGMAQTARTLLVTKLLTTKTSRRAARFVCQSLINADLLSFKFLAALTDLIHFDKLEGPESNAKESCAGKL